MRQAPQPPPLSHRLSWRRVVEAFIVAGLMWLIQTAWVQTQTLAALSAHFDAAALNAAQVPKIREDIGRMDVRVSNNERRLESLETRAQR